MSEDEHHKEGADGILHIRCRRSDKKLWEARAKENNTDLSKWVNNKLNKTTTEEIDNE